MAFTTGGKNTNQKIPIRASKDFPNIGIFCIFGILHVFVDICASGLVFIGILACFATFWSKTYDLLGLLNVWA